MNTSKYSLAQQEARLAFFMLLPPFLFVFLVILFPVVLNFWISVKPFQLAELRTPTVLLRQRISVEEEFTLLTLDLRNSSNTHSIRNVGIILTIPDHLSPEEIPGDLRLENRELHISYDQLEEGFREEFTLRFRGNTTLLDFPHTIDFSTQNPFFSSPFTGRNFVNVLKEKDFFSSLKTTIVYPLGGALGAILLGTAAALLLQGNKKSKGPLSALLLFPYISPVVAVTLIWVFLLDARSGTINNLLIQFGLIEEGIEFLSLESFPLQLGSWTLQVPLALSVLIFFDAWRYFPFVFLFVTARLQALPRQLYEAADVDGAGPFQKLFYITLPQLMGVITTMFILRFMWTFNKFDDVFLLTGGAAGTKTLPVQVYDHAFGLGDLGRGAAVSVLLFIFLAVFLFMYSRYKPGDQQ